MRLLICAVSLIYFFLATGCLKGESKEFCVVQNGPLPWVGSAVRTDSETGEIHGYLVLNKLVWKNGGLDIFIDIEKTLIEVECVAGKKETLIAFVAPNLRRSDFENGEVASAKLTSIKITTGYKKDAEWIEKRIEEVGETLRVLREMKNTKQTNVF